MQRRSVFVLVRYSYRLVSVLYLYSFGVFMGRGRGSIILTDGEEMDNIEIEGR